MDSRQSFLSDSHRGEPASRQSCKAALFRQHRRKYLYFTSCLSRIFSGIIWSEVKIESTGGADPIASHGHRKRDAIRIRELIETFQAAHANLPASLRR